MSFYVFRKDFCYTINGNDRGGLHQACQGQSFSTQEEAETSALAEAERNHVDHFVMETVSAFQIKPVEVVKTEYKLFKTGG